MLPGVVVRSNSTMNLFCLFNGTSYYRSVLYFSDCRRRLAKCRENVPFSAMLCFSCWLQNGEIDIIEGVHDNQHNQVAWHTAPGSRCLFIFHDFSLNLYARHTGCTLNTSAQFTGSISVSKIPLKFLNQFFLKPSPID